MTRAVRGASMLLLLLAGPLSAQRIDLRTRATLYGDNTEFFTPYRTGETLLGGQLTTWLEAHPSRQNAVRVGVFADHRFGSEQFTDSLKPVIAFRHATRHSLGVIGTLETERRHGLLDAIMVSTREITSPIEYGLQWRERRRTFRAESWVNWQRLNTPEQREQFELGIVATAMPASWLRVEGQHLWFHRGGQLYDAGVGVTNNRVTALGVVLHDSLRAVGAASLAVWRLWSDGHIDPDYPSDRPGNGRGTMVRAAVSPWGFAEVFALHWSGHDFSADAGDPNYGSAGKDPGFYRSRRTYTEVGAVRRTIIPGNVVFDAEVRWHRIDDEDSIAFFGTPWELSYRILLRIPVNVRLH